MGFLYEKKLLSEETKRRRVADFIELSRPDGDYYRLLVGSIIIATGGIFTDSIPVVIASMIIAPLSTPILGISLGIVTRDLRHILRQCSILLFSSVIALVISAAAALLLKDDRIPNVLISFNSNWVMAVIVAVTAGAVGASGILRQKVASAALGVAIAVSLMPPLVATGIGLPGGSPFTGSLELYLLNVLGIIAASIVVFWLLGIGKTYHTIRNKV